MIADPFRLFDCCLETDGACAIVLVPTPRARDLRQPVVALKGWASALGPADLDKPGGDLTASSAALLAPRLFARSGVGPGAVDVAELYDAFSFAVPLQLEDYGFCPKGEGGPFVASGAIARTGSIPVNTHGGFLSEGYVHGLNHVAEAVSQLRGQAGPRQVAGAEIAISTSMPGYPTGGSAALVLGRA
jgi:acetyl-CoA acetyltransferase